MWFYYLVIGLTILSNVFYHILLKSTPANINPYISLLMTYLSASILCITTFFLFPRADSFVTSISKLNWTSYALGCSIFGLEIGFLLAYRAGWNINMANLVSTTSVSLLLLPIGFLYFSEKLTLINLCGVILCLAGLLLINHK